jgi:nucleotide-binding universal stress UspA family protein
MSGPIERVVVSLDAVSENRPAIETAARLAARTNAPLHGIFVEDEDLLHLSRLPFARQVSFGAGAKRITTEEVEEALRHAAEHARGELRAAAKRHGVKASFETVRGASERAVAAVSEHDLVVAGAQTRPVAGHFRVECRWWSAIEAAPGPFLLARGLGGEGEVVTLLRDRGPGSARLLAAAAQIAETRGGVLTVVCPPVMAENADFEQWLAQRLQGHDVRLEIEVAPSEPAALFRRLGELGCRVLAIETSLGEGVTARLKEFVERLACDVLIVR